MQHMWSAYTIYIVDELISDYPVQWAFVQISIHAFPQPHIGYGFSNIHICHNIAADM